MLFDVTPHTYRSAHYCSFRLRWFLWRPFPWSFLFYWNLIAAGCLLVSCHCSSWRTILCATWVQWKLITLRRYLISVLNIFALKLVAVRIVANCCNYYLALLMARLLISNWIHLEEFNPWVFKYTGILHEMFYLIIFLQDFGVRPLPRMTWPFWGFLFLRITICHYKAIILLKFLDELLRF